MTSNRNRTKLSVAVLLVILATLSSCDLLNELLGLEPDVVATPMFSLAPGSYTSPTTVSITSLTEGAAIRYTTDGTNPTAGAGIPYVDSITVSETTQLRAIATLADWTDSSVAVSTYTITGTVVSPTFDPPGSTYTSARMVTIASSTAGSTIRYTTNGSNPTATSGTIYTAPVDVAASVALKAIAYKSEWADSPVTTAPYVITGTIAAPTFDPVAGTYTSAQSVAISTITTGAAIRYTIDGSDPTATIGAIYAAPVDVTADTELRAIAYETGWADSTVSSASYVITGTVADPTFSPVGGTFSSSQSVTISSLTPGASIRFTTDGTDPTSTTGTPYSVPLDVDGIVELRAIAYQTDWLDSSVASEVYVVAGPWNQESYVKPSSNKIDGLYGYVDIDGDTMVVGQRWGNGPTTSSGLAYVYVRSGATWSQQALLAAPVATYDDGFGSAVAISGDTIVIGASTEDSSQTTVTNGPTAPSDDGAASSGAAYVFTRSGTTWTQEAYLKASDSAASLFFARVLDISGDTIVVGTESRAASTGGAYVFVRSGTTWSQQQILTASDAAGNDRFARSVSMDGDTIAIGAYYANATYVYTRSGTTWSEEAILPGAGSGDYFGESVGLSGDTLIVGANGEDSNQTTITNGTGSSSDNSASSSGAAYVYTRSGTTWTQQAYIKASNAQVSDSFGKSVAVDGDRVVVGALYEDGPANDVSNSGATYVFERAGSTWSAAGYIRSVNADPSDPDWYGWPPGGVSVSGTTIVVGMVAEDSNQTTITNGTTGSSDNSMTGSGAVYVYLRE